MSGPLSGLRILELAGIGPGPFCGMMLADMGAEVIRIDRPGGNPSAYVGHNVLFRNRRSIALDLKTEAGAAALLQLCENADGLIEGFRPGVTERLGVGPDDCLARNPRLVYGRMTGWGQDGPLAQVAGHDINYIALSGALHAMGRRDEQPMPPLNLVGDFGGGGMMLAFGMVCGLLEAQRSGQGQVVDTSMVEGSAALMAMFYGLRAQGMFTDQRGTHMLDTGAHFYDTYETSDGKHVAIGSIETKFYQLLMEKAELDPAVFGKQLDTRRWPDQKARLAEVMRGKTRDEWCALMEGTDVCFAPVLSIAEAPQHPHNVARESFVTVEGAVQPRPTPRFSRTASGTPTPARMPGTDTLAVLRECGFDQNQLDALLASGAIAQL
ncbi:MAG: CoA transferase [Sandaracinaceae bacterium]|jgi:alpha-methylacyl-CoA racemase|nr:CoA transferase [Sandaracinaceae bacterium]MBK6812465.1 CoA transferase [Sandaracinaceae bacterium]MBK7150746.1 CoA transferase [Sandaracinaceae bacterium]MBK8412551.1 CoA transferase [Sandaracinaceae bacterium]MBP7684111.1 CoA transferase [Deltaproteobacteria bacterium]